MCQISVFFFFLLLQNCWTDANGHPPPAELIISTFEKGTGVGTKKKLCTAGQCCVFLSGWQALCACVHLIHTCVLPSFVLVCMCMCVCLRLCSQPLPPSSRHPFHVYIFIYLFFSSRSDRLASIFQQFTRRLGRTLADPNAHRHLVMYRRFSAAAVVCARALRCARRRFILVFCLWAFK